MLMLSIVTVEKAHNKRRYTVVNTKCTKIDKIYKFIEIPHII